jgi:ABC-type multidrug transport system fused ATPase/permease subunit
MVAVLEVIKRYREMVKIIQNRWRVILAIIVLVILIGMGYVWLVTERWPDWTGFGEYIGLVVLPNQTFQHAKTLWDLMQLLIIPAILAGGAYWLNKSARKQEIEIAEKRAETERKIASDNRQETALQTYLDKMTELLLDKKLRESEVNSEVRAVARARTLTVLRRLDKDRKGALLRFLYEANIIDINKRVIDLSGANLREADMSGANLSGANLSGADMSRANLSGADMSGADMSWEDLIKACLSGAHVSKANMVMACLSVADMKKADMSKVDMSRAKYTKNAKDIRDTIWPDGFDPVAAGAICVNE